METLKKSGFTLIELAVVIVIVAIVFLAIEIKWGTTPNLTAQAMQLADDIRYTQNLSMARNQRYQLVTSSSSYVIQNVSSGATEYSVSLGSGITETSYTIIFNTRGIPFDASGNPLTSVATITLSASGQTSDVTIAPTTGRVTP